MEKKEPKRALRRIAFQAAVERQREIYERYRAWLEGEIAAGRLTVERAQFAQLPDLLTLVTAPPAPPPLPRQHGSGH